MSDGLPQLRSPGTSTTQISLSRSRCTRLCRSSATPVSSFITSSVIRRRLRPTDFNDSPFNAEVEAAQTRHSPIGCRCCLSRASKGRARAQRRRRHAGPTQVRWVLESRNGVMGWGATEGWCSWPGRWFITTRPSSCPSSEGPSFLCIRFATFPKTAYSAVGQSPSEPKWSIPIARQVGSPSPCLHREFWLRMSRKCTSIRKTCNGPVTDHTRNDDCHFIWGVFVPGACVTAATPYWQRFGHRVTFSPVRNMTCLA